MVHLPANSIVPFLNVAKFHQQPNLGSNISEQQVARKLRKQKKPKKPPLLISSHVACSFSNRATTTSKERFVLL
jgi:hypothetical protein